MALKKAHRKQPNTVKTTSLRDFLISVQILKLYCNELIEIIVQSIQNTCKFCVVPPCPV